MLGRQLGTLVPDERPRVHGADAANASVILASWVALVPVPSAVLECALAGAWARLLSRPGYRGSRQARCWSPDRRASPVQRSSVRPRDRTTSGLRPPSARGSVQIPARPRSRRGRDPPNQSRAEVGRQSRDWRPRPPRLARANLAPFIPLGRCFGWPREVRSIVQGVRTGVSDAWLRWPPRVRGILGSPQPRQWRRRQHE